MEDHIYQGCELLTIKEVCAMTKMGRSTVYKKEKAGDFPRRIRLGRRMVRWLRWQVEEWISSRPVA